MRDFLHEALDAWRGLLRRPFYPAATILMLALAIGANMTAFGIFYGYQLRPLPYADPGRLVLVRQTDPKFGLVDAMASPETFKLITATLGSAQSAGLWRYTGAVVADVDNVPRKVQSVQITPSFLTTLGARPVLGRLPDAASGLPGGPAEAAISYDFWKSAFAGRADAIGQRILVNKVNYQVVGVLAPNFGFLDPTDLWAATPLPQAAQWLNNIDGFVPVRLAPGVSVAAFTQQLQNLLPEIRQRDEAEALTHDFAAGAGMRIDTQPLRPAMLHEGQVGSLPILLQGMGLFLLLLAIANAGNLAIVRNQGRMQGFALRRMLGASRLGLLRLFLAEHLPLWLLCGGAGSAIGALALHSLAGFHSIFDSPPFSIATGWPVYVFGWGLASLSILLVALIPAWQISRQRLSGALGQSGKSTLSAAARRAQTGFGALQIALATALLIGSATLSFSLYKVLTQPRGFDAAQRVVASILMPPASQNVAALQSVIDAVQALPVSVSAGGAANWAYPFTQVLNQLIVSPAGDRADDRLAYFAPVLGDYFTTLGIRLRSGQGFDQAALTGAGEQRAIVSLDLARSLFGNSQAIGAMANDGLSDMRVTGVTAPVLWQPIPFDNVHGVIFVPVASLGKLIPALFQGETAIVHVRGGEGSAMALIKHTIEATVPGALVTDIEPLSQLIFANTAFQTVVAGLMAGFALLALVLAALGVYAVNSFIARARQPEFGMRAMLGASPAALLRTALSDAGRLLGFGLGGGLLGGYGLVRAMSSLLFHPGDTAPLIFPAALAVIALIVLAAAWRPAARAAIMPVKQLLEAN